jgi:hypothetical protein
VLASIFEINGLMHQQVMKRLTEEELKVKDFFEKRF